MNKNKIATNAQLLLFLPSKAKFLSSPRLLYLEAGVSKPDDQFAHSDFMVVGSLKAAIGDLYVDNQAAP